jgi:CBS-domain-containing membrane protein
MTREVTTVTPETSAVQVVELLLGKLFKAVPVIDTQRHVVGIITDGDLLRRAGMPVRLAIGERLDIQDLTGILAKVSQEKTAQQIMTSPVITAHENEALGPVVHRLLEGSLKRLPVVNADNQIVGMISRLDVLRAAAGYGIGQQEQAPIPKLGQNIGELMSKDVSLVHVNDDLIDVLQKMLNAPIKRVVVLDEQERAVGVITESDLVARVSPVERPNILQALAARVMATNMEAGRLTARGLMSENVLSAPPETTVVEGISLMLREGRKHLVVIDGQGHPIGIIDRQTLMAASLGRQKVSLTV